MDTGLPFDSSVRGWSRRAPGENFLAWNGGDASKPVLLADLFRKKSGAFGATLEFVVCIKARDWLAVEPLW